MTVGDLITALQQLPPDMQVLGRTGMAGTPVGMLAHAQLIGPLRIIPDGQGYTITCDRYGEHGEHELAIIID